VPLTTPMSDRLSLGLPEFHADLRLFLLLPSRFPLRISRGLSHSSLPVTVRRSLGPREREKLRASSVVIAVVPGSGTMSRSAG